jgi:FMN-dependent NADH-azoreductase
MRTASQRKLDEEAASETQKARIKESEARGNALIDYGQKADKIKQIALDMTSFAENNKRAFNLMQDATFVDSLKRSIEKNGGVVKLDRRTIDQYKLTTKDLEALQMFNQKSAQLTTEMRKASRAPGEGATDKKEGELYAAVEALPTDTARVIMLKSDLLVLRSDFDRMAAELWVDWREQNPNKSFDKFRLASKEYKELRNGYEDALDKMRKANAEMLGTNSPSQRQESSPQGNPPAASGGRGNTRVIDGYIWERDDKGGWNNTGRKAK